jgi:hypothetical protein
MGLQNSCSALIGVHFDHVSHASQLRHCNYCITCITVMQYRDNYWYKDNNWGALDHASCAFQILFITQNIICNMKYSQIIVARPIL